MNCCKQDPDKHNADQKEHQGHRGGHGSHKWMMLLCCGLPLLIIAALPFIDRLIPGSANSIRWFVPFLCPLMMLPMMISGMRGQHAQTESETQQKEPVRLEAKNKQE